MRWLIPPLVLVILSGCLQASVEGPQDCLVFCHEHAEPVVDFSWAGPLLALLFVVLLVGIIIAVVPGRQEQQQQQQILIQVDQDGLVRQR